MPARKNKTPAAGNDYVELDKVGEVDDDVEQMAEVVLSSDEEDEEDDCALIVLKRPPVTERTVEEIEVKKAFTTKLDQLIDKVAKGSSNMFLRSCQVIHLTT